jgi:sugar lactone lactonase YvrE
MSDTPVDVALDVGAEHAEGPLWDEASQRLGWVDITGEAVHCLDPATGHDERWRVRGQPGGVILGAAGEVLVAAPEGLAELDRDTGATRLRVPVERDRPENRANDVKVDARGGPGSGRWPTTDDLATPPCTAWRTTTSTASSAA